LSDGDERMVDRATRAAHRRG